MPYAIPSDLLSRCLVFRRDVMLVGKSLVAVLLVLGSTAAIAAPGASGAVSGFPGAPRSQRFSYGSSCPAAPRNHYLTAPAGCLTVRLADVDGDGRPDLVLLYARPAVRRTSYRFTLEVYRASGRTLTVPLPEGDIPATLERLRNVNGRRGVEIFIHFEHISTDESIEVIAFDGRGLTLAGNLSYGGYDAGLRFGFTCRLGQAPTVEQDEFFLSPTPGRWYDNATTYRWTGATLRKDTTHTTPFTGTTPPRGQVGIHC